MDCQFSLLLVEDSGNVRKALTKALQATLETTNVKFGVSLTVVPGRKQIKVPLTSFDVIISDVNLSGPDANEGTFGGIEIFAEVWRESKLYGFMPEVILYTGDKEVLEAYDIFRAGGGEGDLPLCIVPKSNVDEVTEDEQTKIIKVAKQRVESIREVFINKGIDLYPLFQKVEVADSMSGLEEELNMEIDIPNRGVMSAGQLFPEFSRRVLHQLDQEWNTIREQWLPLCIDDGLLFRFCRVFRGELNSGQPSVLNNLTHTAEKKYSEKEIKERLFNPIKRLLPRDVTVDIENYANNYCYDAGATNSEKYSRLCKVEADRFKQRYSVDLVQVLIDLKQYVEAVGGRPQFGKIKQELEKLQSQTYDNYTEARRELFIPSNFYADRNSIREVLQELASQAIEEGYAPEEEEKVVFLNLFSEPNNDKSIVGLTLQIGDYGRGLPSFELLHKSEYSSGRGSGYANAFKLRGYCQFQVETVFGGQYQKHNLWTNHTEGPFPVPSGFNNGKKCGTLLTLNFRVPFFVGYTGGY